MTTNPVDWDDPAWGAPGSNVHIAENGSHVADCPKEEL